MARDAKAGGEDSEKGWQHGWSYEGYPYLSPGSHFLRARRPSAGAPPWAPHYPYPLGPVGSLTEATVQALDALEMALRREDGDQLAQSLTELGRIYEDRAKALTARARHLHSEAPAELAELEREMMRRLSKIFKPGMKGFLEKSLPEHLRASLERHRLLQTVQDITGHPAAPLETSPRPPPGPAVYSAPQRAQAAYRMKGTEAELSQAVLELPWSGNERWERRWEQDAWLAVVCGES